LFLREVGQGLFREWVKVAPPAMVTPFAMTAQLALIGAQDRKTPNTQRRSQHAS